MTVSDEFDLFGFHYLPTVLQYFLKDLSAEKFIAY